MVFMLAHDVLRGRIYWVGLGIIAGYAALSKKKKILTTISKKLP